jgi:hypothetical protein
MTDFTKSAAYLRAWDRNISSTSAISNLNNRLGEVADEVPDPVAEVGERPVEDEHGEDAEGDEGGEDGPGDDHVFVVGAFGLVAHGGKVKGKGKKVKR